jgi:hypothetical protein
METIELIAAGLPVRMRLRSHATRRYFESFLLSGYEASAFPPDAWLELPPVDADALAREQERLGSGPSFAEYSLLIEAFANPVLRHSRFLFHGVSFRWQGKALILTGPSGVGKTTQHHHWLSQFGDQIELISGDKALIEVRDDAFLVHPSPWTGKEREEGTGCAPLGGIVLLEQGTENAMRPMTRGEAVFPLLLQFMYLPLDRDSLELVCAYEEKLLSAVPVWKLVNRGDPESAALCCHTLKEDGRWTTASETESS